MASGTTCKTPVKLLFIDPNIDFTCLRIFTRPKAPTKPHTPEGFQGNDIPLDGAVVARLVHKRLTLESVDGDDFSA